MRNRGYIVYVVLGALLVAVCAGYAWRSSSAYVVIAASFSIYVLGLVILGWYLKQIRTIASDIDVNTADRGRMVSISASKEGDLAYLASRIDKTLNQLTIAHSLSAHQNTKLADYLADISHQVRTPLTTLSLEIELIKKEENLATIQARIAEIEVLLERIQWLVSALLKMSRLDAGVVELDRKPISITQLVAQAYQPLALAYENNQVEFECELDESMELNGDLSWTAEALTNILKNSLEHTPQGGKVVLKAYQDMLASRISITDTGTGIATEDLPYIFERFYSKSSEVNPHGVGVGLALAQALISAQGGAIKANNIFDGDGAITGACFEIVFFSQVV